MSELREIRRRRLADAIRDKCHNVPARAAKLLGVEPSYINDLLNSPKKAFGEKAARKIEAGLGLELGALDRPYVVAEEHPRYGASPVDDSYPSIIAHRVAKLDEAVQLGVLNLIESFLASLDEARHRPAKRQSKAPV